MITKVYEPDVRVVAQPRPELAKVISDIRECQRQRAVSLKSRIMMENRMVATVAVHPSIGYSSGEDEKSRKKKRAKAEALIKKIEKAKEVDPTDDLQGMVKMAIQGIEAFDVYADTLKKQLAALAGQLHIAEWVKETAQRGFGLMQLGQIVGECGDLGLYANPGKLWRRMGCAPYERDGVTRMPSTWRGMKGLDKLTAAEWEELGYSPRRRSVMFTIADSLVKMNADGPYRARYVEARVRAHGTHPEWSWKACTKTIEEGKNGDKTVVATCVDGALDGKRQGELCPTCGGTGQKCGQAHNHGLLLTGKRLLKYTWQEWNK